MAQEIELGVILEDAMRLTGYEPSVMAIPQQWRALAAMQLKTGIRNLVREKFKMMQRVELRRFRPDWDAATSYRVGNEVWFAEEYWRALRDGKGDTPGADASSWEVVPMNRLKAFISFAQPWEGIEMNPAGVDARAFAYAQDPRIYPHVPPIDGCDVNELGVLLPNDGPKEVYVKFVPVLPNLSFAEWDSALSYSQGRCVYCADTKDVYVAVATVSANVSPVNDDGSHWRAVRVAAEFHTYLALLISAALKTEDQGKYQTQAQAESELEVLRETYHEGMGDARLRIGSFVRR